MLASHLTPAPHQCSEMPHRLCLDCPLIAVWLGFPYAGPDGQERYSIPVGPVRFSQCPNGALSSHCMPAFSCSMLPAQATGCAKFHAAMAAIGAVVEAPPGCEPWACHCNAPALPDVKLEALLAACRQQRNAMESHDQRLVFCLASLNRGRKQLEAACSGYVRTEIVLSTRSALTAREIAACLPQPCVPTPVLRPAPKPPSCLATRRQAALACSRCRADTNLLQCAAMGIADSYRRRRRTRRHRSS
jgi:hypothetical protein